MLTFLRKANEGISMNLLTIRNPTRLGWSDSCPFGLGGYLLSGFAWRIRVPRFASFWGDDAVNNVLEFLGMALNVLLMLLESAGEKFPSILALGDNTSAISWIFKSSKITKGSLYHDAVKLIARHLARKVVEAEAHLVAQHLKGKLNWVADMLTFEGDARGETNPLTRDCPADDELTQRVHVSCPQIVPLRFEISPLPPDVASFALLALQTIESSWIRNRKGRRKTRIELGGDGSSSRAGSGTAITLSSMAYPRTKESSSSNASWSSIRPIASTPRDELLGDVRNQWYLRLYELPQAIWQRRFGCAAGQAPCTSRENGGKRETFVQC
jgi:hypothetical protein